MSQQRTRSSSSHSVFGSPLPELPTNELPTRLQVGKHILFLKESKFCSNKDIAPHLAQILIDLWNRASIPPQSLKNVKLKLLRFTEEASEASKHGKNAKNTKKFEESLINLFDIAGCQCKDFDTCQCVKEMKVPPRERDFLTDQRTMRRMQIGTVDKLVTGMMTRRLERDHRMTERVEDEKRRKIESEELVSSADVAEPVQSGSSTSNDDVGSESEHDDEWLAWPTTSRDERNRTRIPTVALEAERYGVSNRAAAAISTAALFDFGVVSEDDRSSVVDHHKVWRARKQLRKDMRTAGEHIDDEITALFFDGRKDSTLAKEQKGSKWYSSRKVEDHYVLVGEPGTAYLRHITLETGTGTAIADGLHAALDEMALLDKILAVGADSTAVNTGPRGGSIHLLECRLDRPVQWIVCCLHLNELPLRHLCKKLIGPTEGPTQWKGPIGKALITCETLSKADYKCISDGDALPDIDHNDLSRDQAYLYNIVSSIRTGVISDDLLREKPGAMSMARWLTTASRICRLYVGTTQPMSELIYLTQFVVCNYAPMWFEIKCRPRCTDGSNHLLKQIKAQRLLTPANRATTWPVIQRNAYWAHQENLLLAMLADEDETNRKTAVDVIKEIRASPASSEPCIREFRPPQIEDSVETLRDLLPPMDQCTFEPPLTKMLSDEELMNIVQQPLSVDIPCHSQGVERCVRMVTEASNAVYGMDSRDGYIRAVVKSRNFMPSFDTKQDFCAPVDD